jgi:KaiC/GvpD/RAD55 family RecA-like ATPase
MGIDVKEPNTIYVDNPTNLDAINLAVEGAHKAFSNKYKYHKLVFHSLSTLMAYTDPMTIFRFLQNFTSKSKRANGVSLLCMDAGISDPSAVMGLKHLMTGVIEFKIEDLKTYLRVEGLGQVRTQAWIQYTHSTKGLALKGAFEVEHIR